jgi:hypothetical protein
MRGPRVQFCATCIHIARVPAASGIAPGHVCTRLGFRTSPRYSFHCWTPRERYRWTVEPDPQN